jgi:hypothetical protein
MSPARIRTSGGWQSVKSIFAKTGASTWKSLKNAYIKINDGVVRWVSIFAAGPEIQSQVTLSQSTNSTTKLITLTGTNYYWSDALTLQYKFKRSADGGTSWATISSGTATNPLPGSSNTYTYNLLDNKSDVYPNVDNLYVFEVTATSEDSVVAISTSETQSVSAARDISSLSVVTANTTYDSVKLQFNSGLYNTSYFVRHTTGSTEGYFWSSGSGSPTTITVTGLSPSKTYRFYVTPYTGGISSGVSTGYGGNESSYVEESTTAVPVPIQTAKPSITGTSPLGQYLQSVTATTGAYQSGTFGGVTNRIVSYLSTNTAPVDGETTSSPYEVHTSATPVPTLTITQDHATTPARRFYSRDAVTNIAGTTTYYYYSPTYVGAYMGPITDSFNRSVAAGLNSTNTYFYSSVVATDTSNWSTNGSTANNNTTVLNYYTPINPGSVASSYPLQVIELTGKTNLTATVDIPSGGGGPGIAFWVSSAGSFWAAAPSYYTVSSSSTTCTGSQINTDSSGTGCGPCGVTGSPVYSYGCSGANAYPNCAHCASQTLSTGQCTGSGGTNFTGCPAGTCNCTLTNPITCDGNVFESTTNTIGNGTCGAVCSCSAPYTKVICAGGGSGSTCPSLSTAIGGRCGDCLLNPAINLYTWPVNTNVTRYDCTTSRCRDTYTWGTFGTYEYCGPTVTQTGTSYTCISPVTVATTSYRSKLRILSTSGSYVVSKADSDVSTSSSAYNKIYKIAVTTSGDSITATAYNNSNSAYGTVSYSRQAGDPGKTSANGSSYAGLIRTPTDINSATGDDNGGSTYDNLSIT